MKKPLSPRYCPAWRTPIILRSLQKMTTWAKVFFSGDIKGQNLYDQLEIICQSIQASYEVRGTRILVKGDSDN
ncbi:hypothetical protein [Paraflavitalea speifideaquila]|uniref:hypothetical protein n=1 Tax=Paraflavitalea speifideaquila TaxID=3076558 RepID=UPI0028EAB539|nr:hypothetical protein [Paraflavitalea speifideiaquila]